MQVAQKFVRWSAARNGVRMSTASWHRAMSTGGKTHFGFSEVDEAKKQEMVGEVFRKVADKYDVMNDLMSATMHRLWKDEFVRMAGPLITQGDRQTVTLDVAGGTGDIAFRIADSMRRSFVRPKVAPKVIICDINPSMLRVGEQRAAELSAKHIHTDPLEPELTWVEGNAEQLPFPDESVDLYTIAFGIRNVTHVDRAIAEAYRVLRPGGRFMVLEFSRVNNPLLRQVYDAYSFNVIPALGQLVANDRDSYQYLVESIRKFPDQQTFADMIVDEGFQGVTWTDFTFGVCAVHSGFKWKPSTAGSAGQQPPLA